MKTIITLIVVLLVISIGLYLYAKATAPEGYQDESGFHEGKQK